jgi:hypothetical protein
VLLAVIALLDSAALPARNPPPYDDLQAFYRTDQVLDAQVPMPVGGAPSALTVLAQPVFGGAQAAFGLAGDVNGVPQTWMCPFGRGIQQLALPVAPDAVQKASRPTAEVRLWLTGSPSREGDYLLVYSSSTRGGFLVSFDDAAARPFQNRTDCSLE